MTYTKAEQLRTPAVDAERRRLLAAAVSSAASTARWLDGLTQEAHDKTPHDLTLCATLAGASAQVSIAVDRLRRAIRQHDAGVWS